MAGSDHSDDDLYRFVVRGRGPFLVNLRVIGAPLGLFAVLFGSANAGNTGALLGAGFAIAWQALLFRPRIVVTEQIVTVHFLWRSHRADRTTLESVDLTSSTMMWYRTHELLVVLDDKALFFPWIAWMDQSWWWFERPTPTPRQARVLERLRSAITDDHQPGRP